MASPRRTIVDLTHVITDHMAVYPGDDVPQLRQSRFLSKDHYNDHLLTTGMHAGTHIDGPMHLTESRQLISESGVEAFVGEGCLLDVRGQTVFGPRPEYSGRITSHSIALLYSGWSEKFGTPEYFDRYPVVSQELCQLLIEKQIKLLGLDTPSPDYFPFAIHKSLFNHGIFVLENLTHLEQVPADRPFEVIALPLKIQANGSPARVIVRF